MVTCASFSSISFIYSFLNVLVVQGLHHCTWALSDCNKRRLLFIGVHGFLLQWLTFLRSTGSRHTGFSRFAARGLSSCCSRAIVPGLSSCSAHPTACGIFQDQGQTHVPLHWHADFQSSEPPGKSSPVLLFMHLINRHLYNFHKSVILKQCFPAEWAEVPTSGYDE